MTEFQQPEPEDAPATGLAAVIAGVPSPGGRPGATAWEVAGTASDLAWRHRWSPWPTTYPAAADQTRELSRPRQRLAVYACARRLHYAFAHAHLERFCLAALVDHARDPLLEQLLGAARAVRSNDPQGWAALEAHGITGPAKASHIWLTTVLLAPVVPAAGLERARRCAASLAAAGDVVAAYREASVLRRMGRLDEAAAAAERASGLLLESSPDQQLGDHLTERLLVERLLITEARDARTLHRQDTPQRWSA